MAEEIIEFNPEGSKLAEALAKAQGEMKPAHFDKENPHFKSRYATLSSIVEAIRGPLSKYGLSYIQRVEETEKGLNLVTVLMHSSGEREIGIVPLLVSKQDMQGLGSAITYARRFGLSSMVGAVAEEDDDGNAAVKEPLKPMPKPMVTPPSRQPTQQQAGQPKPYQRQSIDDLPF